VGSQDRDELDELRAAADDQGQAAANCYGRWGIRLESRLMLVWRRGLLGCRESSEAECDIRMRAAGDL